MLYQILLALLVLLTSPPAQALPDHLLIDGFRWNIVYVKTLDMNSSMSRPHVYIGATTCMGNKIEVLENQTETGIYDVIMHEIQHAFTCEFGIAHNDKFNNLVNKQQKEDDYHSGIYWATPHWVRFIQDNPEFIRRLEELKPPLVPDDPPPYY